MSHDSISQISQQVMWMRLINIVEEQAHTLIRSSFSTTVRESEDLSAGIFDRQGRMLAQAVTGTPGHVNSMASAVMHFLKAYPIETMSPGDCYITNDPWVTSGHLHDVTVVTPAFHRGKAVALFAATIHVVDIGGRGLGPDGREVYEEGLFIPIMPLARAGVMNEDLLKIIRANCREPIQVEGDVFSCAAAGEDGARRLSAMLGEFAVDDVEALAEYIISTSSAAMGRRIASLPDGDYHEEIVVDGYESPVVVRAKVTIAGDRILVDYAGTSGPSAYGINVVLNYTTAYTSYGIRCSLGTDVPNNYGSLSRISVQAPPDSILNAQKPAPVAARHIVGFITAETMVRCLHRVIEGGTQAESCNSWPPMVSGRASPETGDKPWGIYLFFSGGMGAREGADGLSTTQFPSGVRNVSIEAAEAITPMLIRRKEYRVDSGGAGKFRGGLGQVIELAPRNAAPLTIGAMFNHVIHAPRGLDGGAPGERGRLYRSSDGAMLEGRGRHEVLPGDSMVLELPGGGGVGNPFERDINAIRRDVEEGYISAEAATKLYGARFDEHGRIDESLSRKFRNAPQRTAVA